MRRRQLISRAHPGLMILLLAGMALVLMAQPLVADELGPQIPAASRGEQCVEPLDVIRRDHMRFLMHQRDATVHQGIRTTRHSLKACVSCHARTDADMAYVRIDAEGEFCDSCHSYAAVSIDCFQCHAAKPEAAGGGSSTALPRQPLLSAHQ